MNSTECVSVLTMGIDVDGKVLNENYHINTMLAWGLLVHFNYRSSLCSISFPLRLPSDNNRVGARVGVIAALISPHGVFSFRYSQIVHHSIHLIQC